MKTQRLTVLMLIIIVTGLLGSPRLPDIATAQDDPIAACQELVTIVVASLDSACGALERNSACYGNNRVDATFWEAREDLLFSAPADRVPLVDLATIATAPLDVATEQWGVAALHAQANVPDALPGQAVTFMLMGDASLENRVLPEEAAAQQVTVLAATNSTANLRTRPSTRANIPLSVPVGTPLTLTGLSENLEWYQVQDPALGSLWVFAELVTTDGSAQLDTLPVTAPDATHYGPMQAFYFTTGFGAPSCEEAPSALVIQNPTMADITLNINDLNVTIGSTVVFLLTELPDTAETALILALVEGELTTTINGVTVTLNTSGDALALTLSDDGTVGPDSEIFVLNDPDLLSALLQAVLNAALNADGSNLFVEDILPDNIDDFFLRFFAPPSPAPPANTGGTGSTGGNTNPPPVVEEVTPDPNIVPLGEWGACGSCATCGFYPEQCMVAPDGTCVWNPGSCERTPVVNSWGECGSCAGCGHPSSECVTAPDGACLWDPGACVPPGHDDDDDDGGPALVLAQGSYSCSYNDFFTTTARFINGGGAVISDLNASGSGDVEAYTEDSPGGTSFWVDVYCSCNAEGSGGSINVSITDTQGRDFSDNASVSVDCQFLQG